MVERVARAIWDATEGMLPEHVRQPYEKRMTDYTENLARAAIEAMRVPTEAMTEACRDVDNDEYTGIDRKCAREAWRAMIDAALSEGKE